MNVFELVGKMTIDGMGKTNQQLSGLEKNVQKAQKGMKILGAAFTAVGVAGMAIVDKTKKINAQLGVTALNLGITTKEMRDLTLATTNVTFPIDEVTASFDFLARAGIKDQEVLKATATAFDTLGDAIGMGAGAVTEIMVPAMKTFRLSAEEIASKTDMMTYMVRNSTISLEDFNTMVGYTDQEMVDAGFSIDDMAAAMMYMSDSGVEPGKVMLREWNKAVTLSKKENISMAEALGMTNDELETYKGKLTGATGITQEYADVANEQYTLMDKLKQKWSEITLGASGFLEPLEPVLAGMTALGPLMIGLSTSAGTAAIKWGLNTAAMVANNIASAIMHPLLTAKIILLKAVTAAQWLWNVAMTANPIGLIIVGIAALVAAGIALWKNWDKVSAFFIRIWNNIKIVVLTGVEKILGALSKFMGWIPKLGDKIQEAHDAISNMIDEEKVKKAAREVEGALEDVGEAAKDIIPALEDVAEASELTTEEMIANLERLTEEGKEQARERTRAEIDAIDDVMAKERDAHREKMDALREEYNATIRNIDLELSAELGAYQDEIELINQELRAEEDAERDRRRAEEKTEIETRIAEERDAERRLALERRLNELILESGNETWQAERKLALETKIEDTKNAEERADLEQQLSSQLIALEIERRNEERRLALEARIATETDAEERVRLEEELAEFLNQSQVSQAEAEAAFREEARIAEAEAAEERKALEDELTSYLIELQAEQTKTELELRREALEEKMEMAREEADDAKAKAQEAYDKKSELWEEEHEALIERLEEQKVELDNALVETLQRYEDELEAFKRKTSKQVKAAEKMADDINEALDSIEDEDVNITITTTHIDVYKTKKEKEEEEWKKEWEDYRKPRDKDDEDWREIYEPPPGGDDRRERIEDLTPGLQAGGIAMRPILARIAERKPEAVIPLDRLELIGGGGYKSANIYVMLDGRILAEALEQRLVDDIRLRTGAHI